MNLMVSLDYVLSHKLCTYSALVLLSHSEHYRTWQVLKPSAKRQSLDCRTVVSLREDGWLSRDIQIICQNKLLKDSKSLLSLELAAKKVQAHLITGSTEDCVFVSFSVSLFLNKIPLVLFARLP